MYSRYAPDARGAYRRETVSAPEPPAAPRPSPAVQQPHEPPAAKAAPSMSDPPLSRPVSCADVAQQHPRQWLSKLLPKNMETADLLILLIILLVMIDDDDDLLTILLTAAIFFFL